MPYFCIISQVHPQLNQVWKQNSMFLLVGTCMQPSITVNSVICGFLVTSVSLHEEVRLCPDLSFISGRQRLARLNIYYLWQMCIFKEFNVYFGLIDSYSDTCLSMLPWETTIQKRCVCVCVGQEGFVE